MSFLLATVSSYLTDRSPYLTVLKLGSAVLLNKTDQQLTAREGDSAGLPRPHRGRRAVEVDVLVPVLGAFDAAALKLSNAKKKIVTVGL